MANVFDRIEKKYLLSQAQYEALHVVLSGRMAEDQYGLHTIANLYLDTEDYELIRRSLDKPLYKEKVRLRSYGTPRSEDTVYLELKKKFKGVVYKRRVPMTYAEARRYLTGGIRPETDGQILRELDWTLQRTPVKPRIMLAYDRIALYGMDDPEMRITFDDNLRFRTTQLDLTRGSWGTPILPGDQVLMEVKIHGAMPLWLAHALSELSITQTSFSKYGRAYLDHLAGWTAQLEVSNVS